MKKRIVIFWICMVTICIFLFLYGWSQDDDRIVREFREYSIEIIEDVSYGDEKEDIEKLLNEKGWLNWQLISFSKEREQIGEVNYYLIFERVVKLVKIEGGINE